MKFLTRNFLPVASVLGKYVFLFFGGYEMRSVMCLITMMLPLFFFASCDNGSKKATNDNGGETPDTFVPDDTVTDTATGDDIVTDETPLSCGNGFTDAGEACDGDARECSQINPAYTSGWASCKSDCSGYDTSGCTLDPDADIVPDNEPTDDGTVETDDETVVPDNDQSTGPVTFASTVIDAAPDKPAFVGAEDLDGDGYKELIVSKFANSGPTGAGYVDIYKMATPGNFMAWNKTRVLENIKFPAVTSYKDIDGDGDLDIIVPGGFLACTPGSCGMMAWLEQTPGGWVNHTLVSGQQRFYHHADWADIDGDGIKDLVACGEEKGLFGDGTTETHYFKGNTTADRFAKTPVKIFSPGLGSVPSLHDIDNDGDLDLFSGEYFGSAGSFAWLRNKGGNGGQESNWEKFYIDNQHGKAIQFSFIENLCGDGQLRAVGANHTNTMDTPTDPVEAVYLYEIPADPTQPWPFTKISDNMQSRKSPMMAPQGAPGVFAWGDIAGDSDIDIIVSGDGNPTFFWLEQTAPCQFTQKIFAENLPQGGVAVADFDKNGLPEVVTASYEANQLLLWYAQ